VIEKVAFAAFVSRHFEGITGAPTCRGAKAGRA